MSRATILGMLACTLALGLSGPAQAAETLTITSASFSPDTLGASTNVFGAATIGSTELAVPSPITHVDVFGPAGVRLELQGSETCLLERLERLGAPGCPKNSEAGVGGGEGIYELGKEIVKEKYELHMFLSDNKPGHVEMLILLSGHTPVSIEVVFTAAVVQGRPPYGLGFSLNVPLIKVLPEASDASATSAYLTLGARGHTYVKRVNGRRERLPIEGIVLPGSCPHGGWPVQTSFSFQDGSTVTATRKIACPPKSRR